MADRLRNRPVPRAAEHLEGTYRGPTGADGLRAVSHGHRELDESNAKVLKRTMDDTASSDGRSARLAPPLDPRNRVNRHGLPETQRRYPVDNYIRMWERHHGRRMTPEERKVLRSGCIGVTKLRLGQLDLKASPPTNLAFADPDTHRMMQNAEKVLAPGEVANATVKDWRQRITDAENFASKYGRRRKFTNFDGSKIKVSDYIRHAQENLARARAEARETWSKLAKEHIKELRDARRDARVEGDMRTFEKVRNYKRKFEDILATKPADAEEFLRRVKADPDLAQLRGVGDHLPPGNPAEWELVIYSKHFWSGQEIVHDSSGNQVVKKDGSPLVRPTTTPNATRFAPDPTTGQVDMSGDHDQPKPGHTNYDYGLYDEETGSWWHANHGDWREFPEFGDPVLDPMKVYQSTPDKFFSRPPDFDSSVICIGFAKATP
ncbi:hypothetical protein IU486_12030 [Streptomyces gardneri]|nr:hypothetical protein [Streptomyces gardneri]